MDPSGSDALVPQCGHTFFVDEAGVWLSFNCNIEFDWDVTHAGPLVTLSTDASSVTIPRQQWVAAVVGFSDAVEACYRESAPKLLGEETADGFRPFWREWQERRAAGAEVFQVFALVRGVHTVIYIVTATSTFVLVYAGLTGVPRGGSGRLCAPRHRDGVVRG
jgi:hypothetical protein